LKNSFNKRKKNKKKWGSNWKKNKTTKNLIKWWNWKNKKPSTNIQMTKLEILKNEDWNEKPNIWEIAIEGLNWKE